MAIKKYTNGSWVSASYRKYGTETDAITTLPATVIGDGTPISSYTIKGNMEQSGTPTPSSPIYPSECGDLVASGEHAGQYKLPLTLGSTTTDIYLGEVQTTRRIKKLVLTGEEILNGVNIAQRVAIGIKISVISGYTLGEINTHFVVNFSSEESLAYKDMYSSRLGSGGGVVWFFIPLNFFSGELNADNCKAEFKSYLAAQYAAGTPVTVWYVLAEPETGILNEPIRKIGEYTDSVSGTNLATSGTAQQFDVGTTLKPSELDLTYHGWHEHEDTKFTT